jgi:hypothetical protein
MSTFTPVALPHIAPPDPTKHVDYQYGMVLGPLDFQQEHTYLAERDRRIVRDLIGYGVISGLHVTLAGATDDRGPRLQVGPGAAVMPSGQLVCVSPAQCAYVNEWLRANRQAIDALSTPPPKKLALALVACYRECETDDVPIPGEPCRGEDELMKPSRIQDSFALELRFDGPPQSEVDELRAFVAWARKIPIVDERPTSLPKFVFALEATAMSAAAASGEEDAPPPLAFLGDPLPSTLRIPRARYAEYVEALFAWWVTYLRARARSGSDTAECGCCGGAGALDPGADCLKIAMVSVPLALDDATGELLVDSAAQIKIDESERPDLLHLQMLQEWLLTAPAPPPPSASPPAVVSGVVAPDGAVVAGVGGLKAIPVAEMAFLLTYPGFDPTVLQLVSGQPITRLADKAPVQWPFVFEVLDRDGWEGSVLLSSLPDQPPPPGVLVRVRTSGGGPATCDFTVRIEATTGVL